MAKKPTLGKTRHRNKINTPPLPRMQYGIEDIREGLGALIYGKSKREAEEISGVPANTLVRHFKRITGGKRPNVKHPLNKSEREAALEKLPVYEPKRLGQHRLLFLPHEELMIVEMLETSAQAAFPYNSDALEATAQNIGQATYGQGILLCSDHGHRFACASRNSRQPKPLPCLPQSSRRALHTQSFTYHPHTPVSIRLVKLLVHFTHDPCTLRSVCHFARSTFNKHFIFYICPSFHTCPRYFLSLTLAISTGCPHQCNTDAYVCVFMIS